MSTLAAQVPILHEDDDLVVVSKPAGMLVHRDVRGPREPLLLQTVAERTGRYVHPVHRLDRNTSGLIVFAYSPEMTARMQEELTGATAVKRYLVLARGETPEAFVSERPLTAHNGERRPARTSFRRLAVFSRCSLLDVTLHTGRYHQIRRHLSHLAHHVIGDSTHGKGRINNFFRSEYGLPRMFVHAHRLRFRHPRTHATLDLVDRLPADLRDFLHRLPDVPGRLVDSL